MVHVQTPSIVYADLEPERMLRDEYEIHTPSVLILSISNLLENSWVNQFLYINPFELVCLFTASTASKYVQDDLVHAKTKETMATGHLGKTE